MNSSRYDGEYYPVRKVTDLKDLVMKSTELYGDHTAYLVKDKPDEGFRPITYRQVRKDIHAFGTRLVDMGLKGEKIAVIGESSYYWLLTYFTTVCGVGAIVPLDKNLPAEELANLIRRSGAKALVYSKRSEKSIAGLFSEPYDLKYFISMNEEDHSDKCLSMKQLIGEGLKLVDEGIRDFIDADVDPEQMATLMFTSGTTGLAKGVMLSQRNIAANVYNMSKLVHIPEGGVVLSILPVHHAYEMTCDIWTTFYQGQTIAICEGIKYIQKNMVEVGACIMLGVPLVFEKMYKGMWKQAESRGEGEKLRKAIDLSRRMKMYNNPALMSRLFKAIHQSFGGQMSLFIAGGAAIDPKVIEDFEAMGLPMIQGYGMSENAPIIAVNQDRYSKPASVGKPMPGTEVRIDDPDEFGVGEIVCKGPSVMMGYYDNPEATAAVLKDGWLYTGDLGYFDEDGFLYVSGRTKTVIVTKGGKNIYPEEVESVLLENELIQEVLVHGVVDERVGNVMITADIFPNYSLLEEMHGKMNSSDTYHFYKELVDEINQKLPPYKNVKRIIIRNDAFEKTTTGKIKRFGNAVEEKLPEEGRVDYQEIRDMEIRRAKAKAKELTELAESGDKFVKHWNGRPIIDLKNMIETSTELYGDNVAFMQKFDKNEPYKPITYKQMLADVNGLGTALINLGLKGKRVAVIGDTCYQWESTYLAVVCGTGVVVPLDKELGRGELEQMVKAGEVSAVVCGKKWLDMFKDMKAAGRTGLDTIICFEKVEDEGIYAWGELIEKGKGEIARGDRQFLDAEIIADDMSIILFTSGTTGSAKGVMTSHENIVDDMMATLAYMDVRSDDVFFSMLPVHHTYECTEGFLIVLYSGACVAFCQGLKYIVKDLQEVKPTMILGVPLLIEAFYKKIWQAASKDGKDKMLERLQKLSRKGKKMGHKIAKYFSKGIIEFFGGRIRMIICGGAAINPEVLDFFNNIGIPAVQGYGLTECSPLVALNPDSAKLMKNASVGRVLPGIEVKLADRGDDGIGEICFKGRNIMLGYYNMPEATAEVLDEDGWFHTGDLGYIDEEYYIFITGRKKNVIITDNGQNVYPEELEYYLEKIPYIEESMVWGDVEDESGVNDTSIVATIRLNEETTTAQLGEAFTSEQAKDLIWEEVDKINDKLPYFKRIKKVRIKDDEFEKTAGHKIKRFVESNKGEWNQ